MKQTVDKVNPLVGQPTYCGLVSENVTGPPAVRPATEPTIRVVPKQARASGATRRVRIVNEDGVPIDKCEPDAAEVGRLRTALETCAWF